MSIPDPATRDALKAEFEKAFSPREVRIEWEYGDLLYQIEGLERARIPRAGLSWKSAMTAIQTMRGDVLRRGAQLDDWEPPPPPTVS
ncbi:MAG TPA: hypothetical protein VHC97_27680 [Thermoanaerobaculia bacterium]|jgi:hypothetical protein|nr:hypothetical protein [Thermoanaerobaculia bacterium]